MNSIDTFLAIVKFIIVLAALFCPFILLAIIVFDNKRASNDFKNLFKRIKNRFPTIRFYLKIPKVKEKELDNNK